MDDMMGSLARSTVRPLGSPEKDAALIKYATTGIYSVRMGNYVIHLVYGDLGGENRYQNVEVASEFSSGGNDYIILTGTLPKDNSRVNKLVILPARAKEMQGFELHGRSNEPFAHTVTAEGISITQEDSGVTTLTWRVAYPKSTVTLSISERGKSTPQKTEEIPCQKPFRL